jgi:hypothetical protein
MQTLRKATIKATGKEIQVYKQNSTGLWIDYADCTTTYNESELTFLN